MQPKAIVLLSGGLDSAVCYAKALERGYEVWPLIFDYGQRNKREIRAASRLVGYYAKQGAKTRSLKTVTLSGLDFGEECSLTNEGMELPQGTSNTVPNTYVPARNSIFLAIGSSFAEAFGAKSVWIGISDNYPTNGDERLARLRSMGGSGEMSANYPDCTPWFLTAMEEALQRGTVKGDIMLVAPLMRHTKQSIVEEAFRLNLPAQHTWSCYTNGPKPCGTCGACTTRKLAFDAAGLLDNIEIWGL